MICTWTSDAIYLVLPFSNLRWHWNLSKSIFNCYLHVAWHYSAAGKKSPNVYKSCPKRILLVKWKILTLLQKLPKMCWWFGQNTCCPGLWKVDKSIKNCPFWSHWVQYTCLVRCRLPPLDDFVAVCLVLTIDVLI